MIVERVNSDPDVREQIDGVDINPVVHPIANWSPGVYWPPAIAGGITEVAIQNVVAELQREFDISD
jgi:hypothetical protein